jgi:hypothetical protein
MSSDVTNEPFIMLAGGGESQEKLQEMRFTDWHHFSATAELQESPFRSR